MVNYTRRISISINQDFPKQTRKLGHSLMRKSESKGSFFSDYTLPCPCVYTFCLNLWFNTFFSNIFCNGKSAKSWKFADNLKEIASSQGFKLGTTLRV